MLFPVVLSGGVGSRLWPLSREMHPKQMLPLGTDQSMLVDTARRVQHLPECHPVIVVCNEGHRFLVAEQLRDSHVEVSSIILEPIGRNTAPAVAVAALRALEEDPEAVLLVMPADHLIARTEAFTAAVEVGLSHAQNGGLVTFGIVPTSPETGFGYIKRGASENKGAFPIAKFVEKPPLDEARRFFASKDYLWNSGMFLLNASSFLEDLAAFVPEMYNKSMAAFRSAAQDPDFLRLNADEFSLCPSDSIDFAVMERTSRGMVVPLDCGWSDVGSWATLWEIGAKDDNGNVQMGDIVSIDAQNNYLRSNSRLIAALGVKDLVVVETEDAVLVADRFQMQGVKSIVSYLKEAGRPECLSHALVKRPWGSYRSLDVGPTFQVKHIIVKPGGILSLQLHHQRAEHWIGVEGVAEVTCNEDVFDLEPGDSTFIPCGTKHRLANRSNSSVEIIEVQFGTYFGEDDIVRFEDVYGRHQND